VYDDKQTECDNQLVRCAEFIRDYIQGHVIDTVMISPYKVTFVTDTLSFIEVYGNFRMRGGALEQPLKTPESNAKPN